MSLILPCLRLYLGVVLLSAGCGGRSPLVDSVEQVPEEPAVRDIVVHVPAPETLSPSAAFLGEQLGVAAVLSDYPGADQRLVIGLERSDGTFSLHSIDNAVLPDRIGAPALISDGEAFSLIWWHSGTPRGTVHRARISDDGTVLSDTLLSTLAGSEVACAAALGGNWLAFACTPQVEAPDNERLASVCIGDNFAPIPAPTCETLGRPSLAWDEDAIVLARRCQQGDQIHVGYYSLDGSPSWESLITAGSVAQPGDPVGLAVVEGRIIVASGPEIHQIGRDGQALSAPTPVETPSGSLLGNYVVRRLWPAADHLLAIEEQSYSHRLSLTRWNYQTLQREAVLLAMLVWTETGAAALPDLVVSSGGRAVLVRDSSPYREPPADSAAALVGPDCGSVTEVMDVDLASGQTSAARTLVEPPFFDFRPSLNCSEGSCDVVVAGAGAIGARAQMLGDGHPRRLFTYRVEHAAERTGSFDCVFGCNAVAMSGGVLVYDPIATYPNPQRWRLEWLWPNGSVAWFEDFEPPIPLNLPSPPRPLLVGNEQWVATGAGIERKPTKTPVTGSTDAIECGGYFYLMLRANEVIRVDQAVFETRTVAELDSTAISDGATTQLGCGKDVVGVTTEFWIREQYQLDLYGHDGVHRAQLQLEGIPRTWIRSDDQPVLLVGSLVPPPVRIGPPWRLVRIRKDGTAEQTPLDGLLSTAGHDIADLAANGDTVFVLWKSAQRQIHLTSVAFGD